MVFRKLLQFRQISQVRYYSEKKDKNTIEIKDPKVVKTEDSFSRTGDNGTSKVISGEVLPKDHEIFHAIGATEELLSYLGLAREYGNESGQLYIDNLKRIQTVIIDISTAISKGNNPKLEFPEIYTKELEDWIDEYSRQLPPPEQYIIPGGGVASASLHVARAICRKTERIIVPLVFKGNLDKGAQVYLNRLSDFLFTISRIAAKHNKRAESIYIPKPDQKIQAQ